MINGKEYFIVSFKNNMDNKGSFARVEVDAAARF
jgi:hypothetical protein